MIVTFSEIINEVIRGLGLDQETVETRVLESIKLRTNEAQDAVFYAADWEWRKRTFYMTTTKPHEAGTITVTENSRTVSGSGSGWPDSLKVGYLLVSGKLYKIQSIISSVSLKLEAPFDGATASGLAYKIVFPEYPLNHEISSIVSVKYHGQDITPKTKQRLTLSATTLGVPSECALADRTKDDYDVTGTVQVTQGSNAIAGTATNFSSEMEGMTFRVNEFAKEYTIQAVNSTTSITLRETYDGDTGTAKTYKINPKGAQLLLFKSTPDNYYYIEIEALIKPIKLINNNDISLIPNHMPLIRYAIWLAMNDLESRNPVKIQQAQADAKRTLDQLRDSYRVITNVQWRSERETQSRQSFDPLRRR